MFNSTASTSRRFGLPCKTSALLGLWLENALYYYSYFRLDNAHKVLVLASKLDEWLRNIEWLLSTEDGLTLDSSFTEIQIENLKTLDQEFSLTLSNVKGLKSSSETLRDVELFETNKIIDQWEDARLQACLRKEKLTETLPKIEELRKSLRNIDSWLQLSFEKINDKKLVSDYPQYLEICQVSFLFVVVCKYIQKHLSRFIIRNRH